MSEGDFRQLDILCEGFDDRSFWAGWLLHLGCMDPTEAGKKDARDARGDKVKGGGRFLFESGNWKIVITPYHGRSKAKKTVEDFLRGDAEAPDVLVLNLDLDAEDEKAAPGRDLFHGILADYGIVTADGDGPFKLESTDIHAVLWECREPAEATPGVPTKQTLERLVSSAIHAAYPDRSPTVQDWLDAEPIHAIGPKNFSYSYLAKWYAEQGADDFFRALWRDDAVAAELRSLLEASGAWDRVTGLLASG